MKNEIEKMIGFHREWLVETGPSIVERERKYLREDIKDGSPQAFQQIPDSLDGLATYYGILGSVELTDGDMAGWEKLSTAIDFHGWSLKLRAESFFRGFKGINLTNSVGRAACLVCISEKWGSIAENILRRMSRDAELVDQSYWNLRRFEPFVIHCCKIRDGESVRNPKLEKPYSQVIDAWNDEFSLAIALETVCDYHCQNMDDTGGEWDPEFKHSPFDLIPCEVILVQRIRKSLGLVMPEVSHKLLTVFPIDQINIAACLENDILQQLETASTTFFAGLS